MKEAPNSPYAKLIFRETFRDESSVRKNGGTPTNVSFENGVGSFNGPSSKVNYNLGLNGTYSVRIRCNPTSFATIRYLFDCRGTNIDGVGYTSIDTGGTIIKPSGTSYINGVTSSTILAGVNSEIFITGITLTQGTGANLSLIGSRNASDFGFLGTIELVEIYQGTLTASEVKNLYENKWNKEVSGYGGQGGSNLVTNGTFDTDTGWTVTPLAEISDGKLNFNGNPSFPWVCQDIGLVIGKKYLVKGTVSNYVSGYLTCLMGASTSSKTLASSNGDFSYIFTIEKNMTGTGVFYIGNSGAPVLSVDNISVQEIQPDLLLDFDSTQGTLSDKTVGDTVGNNLITNGGFDTDSTWTKETGWTISEGTANKSAGTASDIYSPALSVDDNRKYRIQFEVLNYSAGSIVADFTGNNFDTITSNGVYVYEYVRLSGGGLKFRIEANSSFVGSIDNVSIYEIRPELSATDVSIKKIGQSYSADFNGTTSKIDTGTDMIGTKAVTICGWIKPYGWGEGTIYSQGIMATNGKFLLTIRSDGSRLRISSNGDSTWINTSENSISLNKWQFVSVTRKSDGKVSFYIGDKSTAPALNGSDDQDSGTPQSGSTNVIIGNNNAGDRTFDGLISQLKVYEGILSLQDITRFWSESRKNYI